MNLDLLKEHQTIFLGRVTGFSAITGIIALRRYFNLSVNKNNILTIMKNCGHKQTVILFKSLIPEKYLSKSDMLICNAYKDLKGKNECVIELLNKQEP